jgi:hypothetical protein
LKLKYNIASSWSRTDLDDVVVVVDVRLFSALDVVETLHPRRHHVFIAMLFSEIRTILTRWDEEIEKGGGGRCRDHAGKDNSFCVEGDEDE